MAVSKEDHDKAHHEGQEYALGNTPPLSLPGPSLKPFESWDDYNTRSETWKSGVDSVRNNK